MSQSRVDPLRPVSPRNLELRTRSRTRTVALAAATSLLGCASLSVSAKADLQKARDCRGWITTELPAVRVPTIEGLVLWGESDHLEPVPHTIVVLLEPATGEPVVAVAASADGRFKFPSLQTGTYRLKTCSEGWNTLEQLVTVDRDVPKRMLRLITSLST